MRPNAIGSSRGGAAPRTQRAPMQTHWVSRHEAAARSGAEHARCATRACPACLGTCPPPPPSGQQAPPARQRPRRPLRPAPQSTDMKPQLPSMCLTSSLQEPSGKSQGIFFFFFPCPSPESSSKAPCQQPQQGLQTNRMLQGPRGLEKLSGPLGACNPSSGDTRLWEQPAPFWSP